MRNKRYLVIGHVEDRCAERVAQALRERSRDVVFTPDVLQGQTVFAWEFSAGMSCSQLTVRDGEPFSGEQLDGVLLRSWGIPMAAEGWTESDWAYVQGEQRAALLAWTWSLSCPVVNRLTAELWFRPQRAYPEWRTTFRESGLPVLDVVMTNDLSAAQEFSKRSGGMVTFTPLTSTTSYQLCNDADWEQAAKLVRTVPLCLTPSVSASYNLVCYVGGACQWAVDPELSASERSDFASGLQRLARRLGLSIFEVQLGSGSGGHCCTGINLHPRIEVYGSTEQDAIVEGICALLGAGA